MSNVKNSTKILTSLSKIFISGALLIYSSQSFATKCFTWQASAAEKGSFVTDDGAALGGGVTNYTIQTLKVTATSVSGINSSSTFTETQPTQGFQHNGTNATQFWRGGGAYTNGSNFFVSNFRVVLFPNFFSITNTTTGVDVVNLNTLSVTLDASGVACTPPALPVSAPIGFYPNQPIKVFANDIKVK